MIIVKPTAKEKPKISANGESLAVISYWRSVCGWKLSANKDQQSALLIVENLKVIYWRDTAEVWVQCRANEDVGTRGATAMAVGPADAHHGLVAESVLLIPLTVLTMEGRGGPSWLKVGACLLLSPLTMLLIVFQAETAGTAVLAIVERIAARLEFQHDRCRNRAGFVTVVPAVAQAPEPSAYSFFAGSVYKPRDERQAYVPYSRCDDLVCQAIWESLHRPRSSIISPLR